MGKRYTPVENLRTLGRGDIIRHKGLSSETYMVQANYGSRVTAITSVDVTNPDEWEVLREGVPSEPITEKAFSLQWKKILSVATGGRLRVVK